MDCTEITGKLRAAAAYLKETRVPIGEKTIIERMLGCAVTLENMAADIEAEQEEKPHDADDQ